MQLGSQEWLIKRAKFPLYVGSITYRFDVFIKYVQVELEYSFTLNFPTSEVIENISPMYCIIN